MENESQIDEIIGESTFELAAELLKAIAHPTRLAIIEMLKPGEKFTVTHIHKTLKIEQAVASHHLNILKNKRVVRSRRTGKSIHYYIFDDSMAQMVENVLIAVRKIG